MLCPRVQGHSSHIWMLSPIPRHTAKTDGTPANKRCAAQGTVDFRLQSSRGMPSPPCKSTLEGNIKGCRVYIRHSSQN